MKLDVCFRCRPFRFKYLLEGRPRFWVFVNDIFNVIITQVELNTNKCPVQIYIFN
jgi:hypothetical protein